MAALIWLLAACGASGDCDTREGRDRDACWYEQAKAATAETLPGVLDGVDDPATRDLLVLRLAVDRPEDAVRLCTLARTPAGRDKCSKVVGRPHMSGGPR